MKLTDILLFGKPIVCMSKEWFYKDGLTLLLGYISRPVENFQ